MLLHLIIYFDDFEPNNALGSLEGVFHYVLLLMFKKFILEEKPLFTIETLNFRISSFDYGPSVSLNKPSELSVDFLEKSKLKYSASEMKVFFMNLPALIGDLVPLQTPEWMVYLKLREIFSIVSAKVCHRECFKLLKTLTEEHNEMFIECFKTHLRPKFHFLLHYATVMDHIGPLNSSCSIRFESKHQEFKRAIINTSSHTNILQTIGIKHQLKFVNMMFEYDDTFSKEFEYGPINMIRNFEFQLKYKFEMFLEQDLEQISWFIYKGNLFKKKVVVQYDLYEDDVPIFGIIDFIFRHNNQIYFALNCLETVGFNDHLFGFEVKLTKDFISVIHVKTDNTISYINKLSNNTLFVNLD